MKTHLLAMLVLSTMALDFPALADRKSVDCSKGQSLNAVVQGLNSGDTLTFTALAKKRTGDGFRRNTGGTRLGGDLVWNRSSTCRPSGSYFALGRIFSLAGSENRLSVRFLLISTESEYIS